MRQVAHGTTQCPKDGNPLQRSRHFAVDGKGFRTDKFQCPFCLEDYFTRKKAATHPRSQSDGDDA